MDRQGPTNRPRYQLTRGLTRTRHEKDAMTSRCLDRKRKYDSPPGECALLTGPAGIIYRTSFSGVWRDRSRRPIRNCPLDRVLTYKNLIYLLNLQFCVCVHDCLKNFQNIIHNFIVYFFSLYVCS